MKKLVAVTLAALLLVGCGSQTGGNTSGGAGNTGTSDAGASTQAQAPSGGDGMSSVSGAVPSLLATFKK